MLFFSANTKWYNNLVNDIYWDAEEGKGKFAESYEEVNLTPEEKAFVDRIDARMTELRQHQFIQRIPITWEIQITSSTCFNLRI